MTGSRGTESNHRQILSANNQPASEVAAGRAGVSVLTRVAVRRQQHVTFSALRVGRTKKGRIGWFRSGRDQEIRRITPCGVAGVT